MNFFVAAFANYTKRGVENDETVVLLLCHSKHVYLTAV